jgi:hypothetical protein
VKVEVGSHTNCDTGELVCARMRRKGKGVSEEKKREKGKAEKRREEGRRTGALLFEPLTWGIPVTEEEKALADLG